MTALAGDVAARLAQVSHATWCNLFAAAGAATFPVLFFVSAPYGKAFRKGWGTPLSGRWGWAVQEVISPVVLLIAWYTARVRVSDSLFAPVPVHVFLFLWCLHYANRAVLYPLQRHMNHTTLPVVLSAVAFNLVNGALVGTELATSTAVQLPGWWDLTRPRVLAGLVLMAFGAWLNISSDARLRALRARGDRSYHLPAGGLFSYCCCPHYLGEILEWTGFAIATASRSGAVFAFWTFANLAPRAWTTRQWYRAKFKERFPFSTKALIPFLF